MAMAVIAPLLSSPRARADALPLSGATMSCDRAEAPGRVLCHVDARLSPPLSIAWADVVLATVPPSVAALRGRVGPHDAASDGPAHWHWDVALAARAAVQGVVAGRVRLVACSSHACVAQELPFQASIVVGSPAASR